MSQLVAYSGNIWHVFRVGSCDECGATLTQHKVHCSSQWRVHGMTITHHYYCSKALQVEGNTFFLKFNLCALVRVTSLMTKTGCYWVVQAGLTTPLTFTWHRLSPLAVFTSGAYFLHNLRRWQWIREVYSASFKGIFEGPESKCAWQQAINCCSCYRMQKPHFFHETQDLLVSRKSM